MKESLVFIFKENKQEVQVHHINSEEIVKR